MKLELPDVTLVVADTRAHELASIAINAFLAKAHPAAVLIYTDHADRFKVPDAQYIIIPDWPDKRKAGTFYYTEAAQPVTTSHALLMEWDGGINDPTMWQDEFLTYDYIGAPWPLHAEGGYGLPGVNVGNGGFMLLSKRLAEAARGMPIATDVDFSIHHRAAFPDFTWAPPDVARRFAFEGWTRGLPAKLIPSFGFHGAFHWPSVLDRADLIARARLMAQNEFLLRTNKWQGKAGLLTAAPWLRNEIGPDIADAAARRYPVLARRNFLAARALASHQSGGLKA